jgi:DNA-directed RNA polymerase sigma subunit (sigma70/sigma32)
MIICPKCGYEEPIPTSERNRDIARRYLLGGVTLKALGEEYKLTPERIRQIVHRQTKALLFYP